MTGARVAAAALAATVLGGCAPTPRPDVVVITLDTLRADRLGSYGNPDGLTPNLDRLAASATVYEDVTAPTPITLPSHATLFTGRYPLSNGVRSNGTHVLPEDETTLAEILRDAGFRTGAVVAAYPLKRRFGLAQGFDVYDDYLPPLPSRSEAGVPLFYSERDAREVTDRALTLWGEMGEGPRFLWVHYFDPHAPYTPPDEYIRDTGRPRYDGEVAFMDEHVGRLLDALTADAPGAIVVVVSDHGESLGEHDEDTHGVFLYQSTLHVPVIVRAPGMPAGARVSRPAGLADVLPTVLGLLALEPPPGLDGLDLRGGGAAGPAREIYAESMLPRLQYRFSELAALREGSLKYVDAPRPELYDLAADPDETHDLHGTHPDEERLAASLAALRRAADPEATRRAEGALDDEAIARLRSLGYTAASAAGLASDAPTGRDPKTMTGWIRRHNVAMQDLSEGRLEQGAATLRELIAEVPENDVARLHLAGALLAGGRLEEAEAELRAALGQDPDFFEAHRMLGEVDSGLDRLDEALVHFRRAAELRPDLAGPWFGMGAALEAHGRIEEAAAAYVEGIRAEPSRAELARSLLALRGQRGQLAKGVEELGALAAEHPRSPTLWVVLARGHVQAGELDEADRCVRRALELDPDHPRASVLAGDLARSRGDLVAAEAAYRRASAGLPEDPAVLTAWARTRIELGDPAAAVTLRDLVTRFPRYAPGLMTLGAFHEQRGERREAAAAYRRALELSPGDPRVRAALARVASTP